MEVARWHNTERPEVPSRLADLLAETHDATLFHIELQSTNDPRMADRMLEQLALRLLDSPSLEDLFT